jgi:hypothetical protein
MMASSSAVMTSCSFGGIALDGEREGSMVSTIYVSLRDARRLVGHDEPRARVARDFREERASAVRVVIRRVDFLLKHAAELD